LIKKEPEIPKIIPGLLLNNFEIATNLAVNAYSTNVWGNGLPTLEGERLFLRGLREEDAPAVFRIYGDPEVIRYWSSPAHTDVSESVSLIEETLKHYESRTMLEWGAVLRETGEVIGTCTLLNIDISHRRAEIGYAFAREFWGKGYASETVELAIAFAFGPVNLHRIEADVHPDNSGSLRLLEKQGFKREGYLRERWHHLGKIEDGVFLGLLRPDWLELKGNG
jgi:ribosomal-protein-alanine N-acetyltransferase